MFRYLTTNPRVYEFSRPRRGFFNSIHCICICIPNSQNGKFFPNPVLKSKPTFRLGNPRPEALYRFPQQRCSGLRGSTLPHTMKPKARLMADPFVLGPTVSPRSWGPGHGVGSVHATPKRSQSSWPERLRHKK